MARRTAETMKTQPGHKPVTTRHPDDEALAGDPEALEEARYRQRSFVPRLRCVARLAAIFHGGRTYDLSGSTPVNWTGGVIRPCEPDVVHRMNLSSST